MEESGTYLTALTPWVIIRFTSVKQQTIIRRFRKQNDALEHLATLRQQIPDADLRVIFRHK